MWKALGEEYKLPKEHKRSLLLSKILKGQRPTFTFQLEKPHLSQIAPFWEGSSQTLPSQFLVPSCSFDDNSPAPAAPSPARRVLTVWYMRASVSPGSDSSLSLRSHCRTLCSPLSSTSMAVRGALGRGCWAQEGSGLRGLGGRDPPPSEGVCLCGCPCVRASACSLCT